MRKKTCKARSCKQKFTPRNSLQVVCSPKCAIEHARALADKKQLAKKKQWAREKREYYANDVQKQLGLTQTVFNRVRVLEELIWFRERGMEPECISCGKTNMDWCCGHFKTVGAQSNLRFDMMNTHLQCNYYCNQNLSGNIEGNKVTRGYKQGLIDRFGEERAQEIIDHCETNTDPVKWSAKDLMQYRKELSRRERELKAKLNELEVGVSA